MTKAQRKKSGKLMPFTTATNNIKYLEVILTMPMQDFYDKNFKSLKKEIEEYF